MQNDRNYPTVGSPSISKSHVGPGIQQKPRIWTLISLIIYDFSSAIVLSWGAHVRPLAMIHGQRTLQFFDGLIWRQWSFWHLYVEGYMVRLTQRSTTSGVPTICAICAPISTSSLLIFSYFSNKKPKQHFKSFIFFIFFQTKNQTNTSNLSKIRTCSLT